MSDKKTGENRAKRPNAGRKPFYAEPTTQIGFKVPISHENEVREAVNKVLEPLKIKKS